ncbi:MAG: hypothetical protein LBF27_06130 [Sphingobacterium sp.]|jgi:hypothetical protein|nr:hypothetical protein [Sphingobacterium sp.]
MNHAKTIYSTNNTAKKCKTTTTVLQAGRVLQLDAKAKRSGRTAKGQTKVPSTYNATDAFLKTKFYTRLQDPTAVAGYKQDLLARDYFESLAVISEKFGITPKNVNAIPYPYNISASLADVKKQLIKCTNDWREVRLILEKGSIYFAKEEIYDTGMTLYYVPIIPLYTILYRKDTEKSALLLLSVYAYLYQILKIPYYREEGCYLNYSYDMLEEWAESEDEDYRDKETCRELEDAKEIGDFMKEMICSADHLKSFGRRVRSFKPRSPFDHSCLILAKRFYEIYRKYRKSRIDRNFLPLRYREQREQEERAITLDDYVSFCANIKGNLFDTLCETVNSDLQEYGEIDEPVRFVKYNREDIDDGNFDFENAVFGRIDDLIRLWQEF